MTRQEPNLPGMIHLENLTKEYESTSGSDAPTIAAIV